MTVLLPLRLAVLSILIPAALACQTAVNLPDSSAFSYGVHVARVLDVSSGKYSPPSVIVVRGTRIVRIVDFVRFDRRSVSRMIEAPDVTVIPGLIDGHVHLAIGGTVRNNAVADLRAGFTTVADLGALTHRLLRLRDSINAGQIEGPRVLAAGIWIGAKGGVCEFTGIGIAGGSDGFVQRVRDNVSAGANLTKVCLSSWPAASFASPDSVEINGVTLRRTVEESHRLGRAVVAHAISRASVQAAIDAGVDGLAHAAYIDEPMANAMRQRGMWMIPTLASLANGDSSAASRALYTAVATARRAGVTLVFGTDGGVLPHGRGADEFTTLVSAGLSPIDIIRMATINGARAFGISDSVGTVRAGMTADFVGVRGDPLRDLGLLRAPVMVVSRGHIVIDPR